MAYIAPIHRPTSIRLAIKSTFLDPAEECLVVAKWNILEFYELKEDGLALIASKVIYGRVTILNSYRPSESLTDHIFVGTDRSKFFTISWNPHIRKLCTERSYMDLADSTARECQTGERCLIDPSKEYLTLEIYEGIITTLPLVKRGKKKYEIERGVLGEPAWSRIPEFFVKSSAFITRPQQEAKGPRLALLWEDYEGTARIRLRDLVYSPPTPNLEPSVEYNELGEDGIEKKQNEALEIGASHLIPIKKSPYGLLILGEVSISYFDDVENEITMTMPLKEANIFVAWERIDNNRYVLADEYGKLYLLMLLFSSIGKVEGWKIDFLGETSRASCLVYLDAGLLFVGSHEGDSQVIRIQPKSIDVIQVFPNIAPILDFTVMDMGNRSGDGPGSEYSTGQARIVTGSGAWSTGSLRSVRSGVGLEDLGVLGEMEHVTDIFALRTTESSSPSDTLLVSFVNETRVFLFGEDGDVEEVDEHMGLSLTEQTLLAANLSADQILQVTSSFVRLIDLDGGGMVNAEWIPDRGRITAVSRNDKLLALSMDGKTLTILGLNGSLTVQRQTSLSDEHEMSCVELSPLLPNICIIGLWKSSSVSILDLESLSTLKSIAVTDEDTVVPRSILVAQIFPDSNPTLFISLADGHVVSFDVDPSTYDLSSKKTTILGTRQADLRSLSRANGLSSVFVSSEHSTLIYSDEGRMTFSAVAAEKVTCVCPFSSIDYPDAVAIATSDEVRIGHIDSERTTHVQTLRIDETVRRIAYSRALKAFGIGTIKRSVKDGAEIVESSLKLADEIMFKELDTYELGQDELIETVIRAELDDGYGDLAERFLVGTSYLDDNVAQNFRGRILVFEVTEDRRLKLVAQLSTKGACRCLAMVNGMIAAALVKTIVIYRFEYKYPSTPFLNKTATYRTSTAPIDIVVSGNRIFVADLMKSVSIIEYKKDDPDSGHTDSLTEVARHYETLWATALAQIQDETWLESDAEGNLVLLSRDIGGVTEDDKRRLRIQSEYCLGEFVNRIKSVDVTADPNAVAVPKAFLATREGSIYLFALISQSKLNLLLELQELLAELVESPGNIPFEEYRAFKNQVRVSERPVRFADGELIERFLDCDPDVQEKCVARLNAVGSEKETVESVKDMIESLKRMH